MKYESLILTIILLALAILFASSLKSYLPEKLKLENIDKKHQFTSAAKGR